jgi:hypothetical protein
MKSCRPENQRALFWNNGVCPALNIPDIDVKDTAAVFLVCGVPLVTNNQADGL